jgi:aconitate hydratase
VFTIESIAGGVQPGQEVHVRAVAEDGSATEFVTRCRIDTPVESEYYRHGGILQYVLRDLMSR